MSKNVEIKAHLNDLNQGRLKAEALGAKFVGSDHQLDTYFKVPNGRLKLRESSLSGNFLIPYLRPDDSHPKDSRYVLLPVEQVAATRQLLTQMFGVRLIVEKERAIFLWQNVRIHLDQVKHLGYFLEFEAIVDEQHSESECRQQIAFLLKHFEIAETNLIAQSYADLLSKAQKP